MEENDKEGKKAINTEFIKQKVDSDNYENVIDFRWSDGHREDEEDISKIHLFECLKKQTDEEILSKSNSRIDYYGMVFKEKK